MVTVSGAKSKVDRLVGKVERGVGPATAIITFGAPLGAAWKAGGAQGTVQFIKDRVNGWHPPTLLGFSNWAEREGVGFAGTWVAGQAMDLIGSTISVPLIGRAGRVLTNTAMGGLTGGFGKVLVMPDLFNPGDSRIMGGGVTASQKGKPGGVRPPTSADSHPSGDPRADPRGTLSRRGVLSN